MIKFADLIKTKISGCARCFSILYAVPCQLDPDIAKFFKSFGRPIYPLGAVSLLKIKTDTGFDIEGRMRAKVIKFSMPKKYSSFDINNIAEKIEFEKCLLRWMESKLNITITG